MPRLYGHLIGGPRAGEEVVRSFFPGTLFMDIGDNLQTSYKWSGANINKPNGDVMIPYRHEDLDINRIRPRRRYA